MSASPAHMPQVAKRTVKSSFLNYLITLNLSFDLQLLATVQRPYPPQLHIMFALKKKRKRKAPVSSQDVSHDNKTKSTLKNLLPSI